MKNIMLLVLTCTLVFIGACDNCTKLPTEPEFSLVGDDDGVAETKYVEPFLSPWVRTWEGKISTWRIDQDRECGGEGWRMIPRRLQPCTGVTFYSYTDENGRTSICADSPPCDTLTQGQINAMYLWAIGTDDIPSK